MRSAFFILSVALVALCTAQGNFNLNGKKDLQLNVDGELDRYWNGAAGAAAKVKAKVNRRDDYAPQCRMNDACDKFAVVSSWELIFEDGPYIIFCSCENSRWPLDKAVDMLGKVPLTIRSTVTKVTGRQEPGKGGGFTLGGSAFVAWDLPGFGILNHEMGHNFDAANSISYSKGFEQAVMADSCYTSTYGATARHEYWACLTAIWAYWAYQNPNPASKYPCNGNVFNYTRNVLQYNTPKQFDSTKTVTIQLKGQNKFIGSSDGKTVLSGTPREFKLVLAAFANYLILDARTYTTIDTMGRKNNNDLPQLNSRNGGPNQQYIFKRESDGFYTIRNFANNLLLEGCSDRIRMTSGDVTDCHKWRLGNQTVPDPKPTQDRPTRVITETFSATRTATGYGCANSQELRSSGPDTLTSDAGVDLTSPNCNLRFVIQGDGNLVVYDKSNKVYWASGKFGNGPHKLVMQGDGNLVQYGQNNNIVWKSDTYLKGKAPFVVSLSDNARVSITDSTGEVTWTNGL